MAGRYQKVSIIGAGVVGTSLACLAHRAGRTVVAVAGRRLASAREACRMLGTDVAVDDPAEAARRGQIVLITTPDDVIGQVCRSLAESGAFQPGTIVAHCSGVLSSEVLDPAKQLCGAHVASVHPMQTFPTVARALSNFAGTWCFAEGDAEAVVEMKDLFEAIGGRVEEIRTAGKVLYHAAAVMACNYLVVLLEAASTLAKRAGIDRPQAMAAMQPLIAATLDNVNAVGPADALTGPIARGDVETVERHIDAIERMSPDLAVFYRVMGRRALAIAKLKGTMDETAARRLHDVLR